MSCQVLPVNKIDKVAKLNTKAFSNSPAGYTFIFQHDAEYLGKALEWWLLQRNLILIQRCCPLSFQGVLDESDKLLIACFLWTHSSYHANISTWDMIKVGM